MKTVAGKFADFFHEARYEDLSSDIVDHAKHFILDYIGVAMGGWGMPFPQVVIDYLTGMGGNPEATLLGKEPVLKIPAVHAAFGNGVCGHALDMDDGYRLGGVHPGVCTIPAAIAAGEIKKANGKLLILATVLGSEIINRLAGAMNPSHLNRGFQTTGTLGVFGAAAAAGKIFGLDSTQFTGAIGMAGLQGAGVLEVVHSGTMTKPMLSGKAAMAGIISAELAQRGAQGPATVFEGEKGVFKAMADEVDHEFLFDGLGERYLILDQYVKPHAACRHVHPAVDAVLRLREDHRISFSDIEAIDIRTYPVAVTLCGGKNEPESGAAAKFSIPFSVALAAYFGDAGMNRFCDETIENKDILDLSSRVSASAGKKWAKRYPHKRGASMQITTNDGNRYAVEVDLPKGEPENPASLEDLVSKFRSNAGHLLKERCDPLIFLVMDLENHSVEELTRFFTF
jgi:2-methylcitrate dehydratase PrpD